MYVYIYLYINIHGDVATLEGSPNIHTYYILIVYTLYINVLIYIFVSSLTRQEARPGPEAGGRRGRASQFCGLDALNSTHRKGVLDNETIRHCPRCCIL